MDRTFVMIDVPGTDAPAALFERLENRSCLALVVRQALDSLCLDRVAIVVPAGGDAQAIQTLRDLVPPNVTIFASTLPDSLGRLTAAARELDATAIIRVDGTQMLVDPAYIDRLLVGASEVELADYIGFVDEQGRYLAETVGLLPEWCKTAALERADREAYRSIDRAGATRYVRHHPRRFELLQLPVSRRDLLAARRCVSYMQQDWEGSQAVLESLQADTGDWRQIVERLPLQLVSIRD